MLYARRRVGGCRTRSRSRHDDATTQALFFANRAQRFVSMSNERHLFYRFLRNLSNLAKAMSIDQQAVSDRHHGRIRALSIIQSMGAFGTRGLDSEDRLITITCFGQIR